MSYERYEPFQKPPYFDWTYDRWKLLAIVLLFLLLLFGTLFGTDLNITRSHSSDDSLSDVVWTGGAGLLPAGSSATSTLDEAQEAAPAAQTGDGTILSGTDGVIERTAPVSHYGDMVNLPLTLSTFGSNAIVSSSGITLLSGTAQAMSRVEVYDQPVMRTDVSAPPVPTGDEVFIGMADVDARGFWNLTLEETLEPGQHIITLHEIDESGGLLDVTPAIVVFVLGAGETGPLSLATPYIRFPLPATQLRAGSVVFHGSGIPGMQVRLYLNGDFSAEAVVNSREEWRLAPESELDEGIYVAEVEALGADGTVIAKSPPVAFSVVPPVETPSQP